MNYDKLRETAYSPAFNTHDNREIAHLLKLGDGRISKEKSVLGIAKYDIGESA